MYTPPALRASIQVRLRCKVKETGSMPFSFLFAIGYNRDNSLDEGGSDARIFGVASKMLCMEHSSPIPTCIYVE